MLKHVLLLFTGFLFLTLGAQEPLYHVNTASPVLINPAYAGTPVDTGRYNARIIAGSQSRFLNAFASQHLTGDFYNRRIKTGFGITMQRQSIVNTIFINSFSLIVNRSLYTSPTGRLRMAIQAGYERKKFDFVYSWHFYDHGLPPHLYPVFYDSVFARRTDPHPSQYFTLGTGLLWEQRNFEAGIAFQNINRPNWSFTEGVVQRKPVKSTLNTRWRCYNGMDLEIWLKALLSLQTKVNQLDVGQMSLGTQLKSGHCMFGIQYNQYITPVYNYDFMLFSAGFTYKAYQIRYAWEHQVARTNIKPYSNMSLSLQYNFLTKARAESPKAFKGLRFRENSF